VAVLSYLALQDKRYKIIDEYLIFRRQIAIWAYLARCFKHIYSFRVRVDDLNLRTAQDDNSIVFSTPNNTYIGDLPLVFSFKLEEGKLAPSPSKFAIQKINTKDVWAVPQFEIYNDKILYARS
jgi:hypothetical protein